MVAGGLAPGDAGCNPGVRNEGTSWERGAGLAYTKDTDHSLSGCGTEDAHTIHTMARGQTPLPPADAPRSALGQPGFSGRAGRGWLICGANVPDETRANRAGQAATYLQGFPRELQRI